MTPAAAGIKHGIPQFFAISMAGVNKDQKLTAIVTPAAKPSIPSRTCLLIVLNINTDQAPMAVSAHVKRVAITACLSKGMSVHNAIEAAKDYVTRAIQDASAIEPIPVSVSYSSFLLSTSSLKSYAEAITSVLPCFWSYAEIADHHREMLITNKNQLYKDWGKIYVKDSYLHIVEKIKMLVNKAGEGFSYEKLKSVFIAASRYEYMFWDAVYNQQEWPV